MKDILNNKKMLYVGIALIVLALIISVGTYAYYSTIINGTASGQVLAYTCTGNNTTSFTLDPFNNAYPGYSATRTISLNASLYTNATINVSSYTNMGAGSVHPNLLIYNDAEHQNAMSNGVNTITTSITPGTTTNVPIYIYWPYGNSAETYSSATPSATITITCNQGVDPAEVAAAKFASGKTCVAVTNISDLHTKTCNGACAQDVESGSTFTYGTIWNGTGTIPTGAAFDCDVNNNGVIDKTNGVSTERFYYVSDRWNEGTNINSFDTTTAVLIYYKDFISGAPSNNGAAYATKDDIIAAGYEVSSYDNWHGPVTAVNHLPKTTGANAWRSDLLTTRSRTIYACDNADCSNTPSLTTNNGSNTITNPFNYGSTTAARLLTIPELAKGCKTINGNTSLETYGSLSACNFLLEETKYDDTNKITYGPWLETSSNTDPGTAWYIHFGIRGVSRTGSVRTTDSGVRPTIEVAKSKLG